MQCVQNVYNYVSQRYCMEKCLSNYFARLHIIMFIWIFTRRWSCSIYGIVETNSAYNARVGMALALVGSVLKRTISCLIFITNALKRSARTVRERNRQKKNKLVVIQNITEKHWHEYESSNEQTANSKLNWWDESKKERKRGIKIHRDTYS